jgi:hypothetical protein
MRSIKVKELEVPLEAMGDVAAILSENEITNTITGADDDHEIVLVEVQYEKDEKEVISEIEEIISDYAG